jgi:hypothetical protein
MATNELYLTIDFNNVEIVKEKTKELYFEIEKLYEVLKRISRYEETGDKSFDIKMIKVIASVALLN